MFNLQHILFMIFATISIIVILILLCKFVKTEHGKTIALRTISIITLIIHYSSIYYDFFTTGNAYMQPSYFLLIYPCHICMWGVLIVSLMKNRQSKLYQYLSEFFFYAIAMCGIIGIILNENFGRVPTLTNYFVLKGLVSHATMVLSGFYLLFGNFMTIRVHNTLSGIIGLLIFAIQGTIMNALYAIFGLSPTNSMYLLYPPYASMPWLNAYTMAGAAIIFVFVFTLIYEACTMPKEARWLYRWRHRKNKKQSEISEA